MPRPRVLAAFILGLVAVAQALRVAFAWPVTINSFSVPLWASAIAAVVAGGLAILLWRDRKN